MPYLNTDDRMHEHPKVDEISDAAFRMWHAMLSYSSAHFTDGYVPLGRSRRLTPSASDAAAAELVAAGMLHDVGQGCDRPECIEARTCLAEGRPGQYLVHDYLQWNHSAAWWKERRRKEAERIAKWRAKKQLANGTKPPRQGVNAHV